jgi:hypothetical protein
MKVIIKSSWTFEDTFDAAYIAYSGSGITSRGYRNSVLMAWGNMVGRKRALSEFNRVVKQYGSKKAVAEAMGISSGALRKIENHFLRLPESISVTPVKFNIQMTLNKSIDLEEDRECECKEITSDNRNPIRAIINAVDEYAVSFLNSKGGRIYWGIANNTQIVKGVKFTHAQKDELRRGINNKIVNIQPSLDSTAFGIHFNSVYSNGILIKDIYVLEVCVPKGNINEPYFTGSGDFFVRVDGVTQKLKGPAMVDWIKRRILKTEQDKKDRNYRPS